MNFPALARDVKRSVEIDASFELTDLEISRLDTLVPEFAIAIVKASLGNIEVTQGPLALVQYLSSQTGEQVLKATREKVASEIHDIKSNRRLLLGLTIDAATGTIRGSKQLDQIVFTTLEGAIPAHQAIFSYFPADRALPAGEVNIQIGGPDIAAQLETHNSQPQTKFHRLKPTIVNNFLLSPETRDSLLQGFSKIFSRVLRDRELIGIHVSEIGLLSILIKECVSNRTFDIDGMSSGEKGLILTFLLISHSVSSGGIIMIDEPELHLNPAVCKSILPFLIEEYLKPQNIQAIICSHSPEILGCAFDSNSCRLQQLQSPTTISPIYSEDRREVFEALRRLGTSASDVLFSAGSIFVEGEHDIEILKAALDQKIVRYNITQLGGRSNIEKEINTIRAAEINGELATLKCFIFDLDNAPTDLQSSRLTKILQWKRHCLENYLIDEKIIYDLLRDQDISQSRIDSRGEVNMLLQELALSQLNEVVAKSVYNDFHYQNSGLRSSEIKAMEFTTIANTLFNRIERIQEEVSDLKRANWTQDFVARCVTKRASKVADWQSDWIVLCDGKRFFLDLHKRYGIKVSPLKFKKMIAERMQREQTDNWTILDKLVGDALTVTP